MGLFETAIRAATGAEKEGLAVLTEVLAELSRESLSPEARKGAVRTVQAVLQALKKRGVATKETESKALRMTELYEKEGAL
jgi:uncharacterized protein YggE